MLQKQNPKKPTIAIIYDEKAVRKVAALITCVIYCVIILLPIVLLYFTQNKTKQLLLVLVFGVLAAVVTALVGTEYNRTFVMLNM
jgi:preprotein translocase subunit SecF